MNKIAPDVSSEAWEQVLHFCEASSHLHNICPTCRNTWKIPIPLTEVY